MDKSDHLTALTLGVNLAEPTQPVGAEPHREPVNKTQTHTAALLAREGALVSAARGAQSGWSLALRSKSQTEPGPPQSASSWKQEVTSQPTSQSQTPTAAGFTKRLQVPGSPSEPEVPQKFWSQRRFGKQQKQVLTRFVLPPWILRSR